MSSPQPEEMPNLTLVVLAYDEEHNVGWYLRECLGYLDTLPRPGSHEVLLIDDGSTDGTATAASEIAAADDRVRVISHGRNLGMGAGMRTGIGAARGDYVTILAADGQVSARELDRMLPALARAPLVLSVYSARPGRLGRVVMSTGLRLLARLLVGVSFRLEGIYLFPVAVARDEIGLDRVESNTFFFSFELISRALARGHRATTVTIAPRPRRQGRSKVANLERIGAVALELWRFSRRLRQERR